MHKLAGRSVLVVGPEDSLGQEVTRQFSDHGAQVALMGNSEEQLISLSAQLQRTGRTAMNVVADRHQAGQLQRAVEKVCHSWGRIDVVFVNSEPQISYARIEDLHPDEWDESLRKSLRFTLIIVREALLCMKKSGGSVILTSPFRSDNPGHQPGTTLDSCAAAAQFAFMRAAAAEMAAYNIRVNMLSTALVQSEHYSPESHAQAKLFPAPLGLDDFSYESEHQHSEELASLALYLASDDSKDVTGQELKVDYLTKLSR